MILAATNQMRPVDWRWQRAQYIVEYTRAQAELPTDDAWIRVARAYLGKYKQLEAAVTKAQCNSTARNDVDKIELRLDKKWHAVSQAHQVHRVNDPIKWGMEAMLVAGMSDEEMEAELPCETLTIAAYAALFFDVRDRMRKAAFRMTLYPEVYRGGLDKSQCSIYWKFVGFHLGPQILRLLWYYGDNKELMAHVHEATLRVSSLSGLQAALSRDINRYTVNEIVEQAPVMQQLRDHRMEDAGSDAGGDVKTLLDSIRFGVRSLLNAPTSSSEFRQGSAIKRLAEGAESGTTKDVDVELVTPDDPPRQERVQRTQDIRARLLKKREADNEPKGSDK